jgi:hypothetical protein
MLLIMCCYLTSIAGHLCENVEQQRKERDVQKGNSQVAPGVKWMMVVEDHPQMIKICVQRLSGAHVWCWYLPYTKFDLPNVEEEGVLHLCHHGERLATAFSLMNTAPGTPFQVKKICGFVERVPRFHKVHSKNSWESNHGEECRLLSSLWGCCLFLHGLLVMPVVCLLNCYIKFIIVSSGISMLP